MLFSRGKNIRFSKIEYPAVGQRALAHLQSRHMKVCDSQSCDHILPRVDQQLIHPYTVIDVRSKRFSCVLKLYLHDEVWDR